MSYRRTIPIILGRTDTGLTLKAILCDQAGATVGSEVTTGFTEIGFGMYLWDYSSFPDNHRGAVKFYTGTLPTGLQAIAGLDPLDGEKVKGVTLVDACTLTTTTTTLTNLPAITSNWLTATGIAASALDGKGDWNIGKTGYSLTNLTISGSPTLGGTGTLTITGAVATQAGTLPITTSTMKADVDTIKTQAVTCASGVTILASVGTAATSTAQTGDSYARLGAPVGASISADIAANPDANIAAMKIAFGDGSYVATGVMTSAAAGSISETSFTIPTPTANTAPTGPIGWLNFLFARFGGARVKKNSSALTIATYLPSDSSTVWLSGSYTTTSTVDTTEDVAKAS